MDSHSSFTVSLGNVLHDNSRYGLFFEERGRTTWVSSATTWRTTSTALIRTATCTTTYFSLNRIMGSRPADVQDLAGAIFVFNPPLK